MNLSKPRFPSGEPTWQLKFPKCLTGDTSTNGAVLVVLWLCYLCFFTRIAILDCLHLHNFLQKQDSSFRSFGAIFVPYKQCMIQSNQSKSNQINRSTNQPINKIKSNPNQSINQSTNPYNQSHQIKSDQFAMSKFIPTRKQLQTFLTKRKLPLGIYIYIYVCMYTC